MDLQSVRPLQLHSAERESPQKQRAKKAALGAPATGQIIDRKVEVVKE
jgi:hypothetical protein